VTVANADATGARGAQAHGIGRSRGGLTTKIHAAVDALGLPVRLIPTAGQRGDCPQAAALIDGLEGVGHVIADAAYDSEPLCEKIEDDLGAEAHIQANPSRAIKPPLDPGLYAERHKIDLRRENDPPDRFLILLVFQRIKRFRASPCAARQHLPASWASSSSSPPPTGSDECRQGLVLKRWRHAWFGCTPSGAMLARRSHLANSSETVAAAVA
jgi:transposase